MLDLKIENLHVSYGEVPVLRDIHMVIHPGEVVAMIGPNGAGKTTLLKTISGLLRPSAGRVIVSGDELTHASSPARVAAGISHVPEGRQLFLGMTVRDNLLMGAYKCHDRQTVLTELGWIFKLFPELKRIEKRQAGLLSGGEQQMCSLGRGLMTRPGLLMIDEMSAGLAPLVTERLRQGLREIHKTKGISMLLVDQDVFSAFEMASRGYVLETGRIVLHGPVGELIEDSRVQDVYLGL